MSDQAQEVDDYPDLYMPSGPEIWAACLKFRRRWSPQEETNRRKHIIQPMIVPIVPVRELGRPEE